MGIDRLVVNFDGKAQFSSQKPKATWHCFWGKYSNKVLRLTCTPSTSPSVKKSFSLNVIDFEKAQLYQVTENKDTVLLATFSHLDENPAVLLKKE